MVAAEPLGFFGCYGNVTAENQSGSAFMVSYLYIVWKNEI